VDEITLPGVLLGLVGGLGSALLAEFFRRLHAKRAEPKLRLQLVDGLAPSLVAGNPTAYARLDIHNDSKSGGAIGVSVRIERVIGGSPGDPEKLRFLERWQLAWANEDRGNPNVPPEPKGIPPGGQHPIDLAHLNSTVHGEVIVDIRPQPNNHLNYLGAGAFTLVLVVGGDNARARRYEVDLVHDGERWDGEHASAGERLRLEKLRAV
jgi:hypothetical protein